MPQSICVRAADVAACYARTFEHTEGMGRRTQDAGLGTQDTAGTKVVQTNGVKRQGKLVLLLLLRLPEKG